MKRFMLALFLGSSTFGLVGCSDTDKATTKTTIDTPNGSLEKKTTTETTATGDQKPAAAH